VLPVRCPALGWLGIRPLLSDWRFCSCGDTWRLPGACSCACTRARATPVARGAHEEPEPASSAVLAGEQRLSLATGRGPYHGRGARELSSASHRQRKSSVPRAGNRSTESCCDNRNNRGDAVSPSAPNVGHTAEDTPRLSSASMPRAGHLPENTPQLSSVSRPRADHLPDDLWLRVLALGIRGPLGLNSSASSLPLPPGRGEGGGRPRTARQRADRGPIGSPRALLPLHGLPPVAIPLRHRLPVAGDVPPALGRGGEGRGEGGDGKGKEGFRRTGRGGCTSEGRRRDSRGDLAQQREAEGSAAEGIAQHQGRRNGS